MTFEPQFLTTTVGSFPHLDGAALCRHLVEVVDIPAWPQLPRRTFYENMYVQYSDGLPRIVLDNEHEKITFDTSGDLSEDLEAFYTRYLAEDIESFGLTPQYSTGFFNLLDALQQSKIKNQKSEIVKGQVTGPISLGLTVTDQNLRASLYNDMLADAIVKQVAMNARWQVQKLKAARPNVIIFVDEPYMASFGSAYISLSREQVITMLDEVFAAIHQEGGLAGTHCCGNTDWSVLLATTVDILNLDAYGFLESLALYPTELRGFLDRGGVIAWGIVPNNEEIYKVTAEGLAQRLRQGMALISEKARGRGVTITTEELAKRSLLVPNCGLGSTTIEVAEQVLVVLAELGKLLRS